MASGTEHGGRAEPGTRSGRAVPAQSSSAGLRMDREPLDLAAERWERLPKNLNTGRAAELGEAPKNLNTGKAVELSSASMASRP